MIERLCKSFFLSSVIVLASCGGNRDGTPFVAQIDFAIPEQATDEEVNTSELRLSPFAAPYTLPESPTTSSNILARWGRRMELVIERTNALLTRVNDRVATVGEFEVTVASGTTIAGRVTDLTGNSEGYERETVVCVNDAPYLHVQWNLAQTKVRAVRDFNVSRISGVPTTDMKVEVKLVTDTTGTTLTGFTTGVPFVAPADVRQQVGTETPSLGEWVEMKSLADGRFEMRGVNAWSPVAYEASSAFTSDAYLTGWVATNGTASYVASRVYTTGCSFPFNESAPTGANGYCFTGAIGTSGTVTHTAFAPADWTEELQDIGVARAADIKFVKFDEGLGCAN